MAPARDSGDRPSRDAVVARLRSHLATRAVDPGTVLPLCPPLDAALPGGGLAAGLLHEVSALEEGDGPAALGLVAALLARVADASPEGGPGDLLLVARAGDHGALHGHGLAALGLDPGRLLLLEVETDPAVLWALAEALRSRAVRAAAGVLGGALDLTASRRLHLLAEAAGAFLVVLRPPGADAPNAAATRWRVRSRPAERDAFGLLDRPRWEITLERVRNGRPGCWLLEWDHGAHRLRPPGELADPAFPEGLRRAG